jgi:hypothetical protein
MSKAAASTCVARAAMSAAVSEDRLFKRPFPSPRYPALGSVGRNTAPVALESVFGCRLRSAGDLSGVDGPAPLHRSRKPSGRATANGRTEGFTKLLFDDSDGAHGHGKILGGGIVGLNAVDIGKTTHPRPTLGESIGMAAEVAHGSCTDLPPARKWHCLPASRTKPGPATDRALCFSYLGTTQPEPDGAPATGEAMAAAGVPPKPGPAQPTQPKRPAHILWAPLGGRLRLALPKNGRVRKFRGTGSELALRQTPHCGL